MGDHGAQPSEPGDGSVAWLAAEEFFSPGMRRALVQTLGPGQSFGFNYSADGQRIWVKAHSVVDGVPAQDTHEWVRRARGLRDQ